LLTIHLRNAERNPYRAYSIPFRRNESGRADAAPPRLRCHSRPSTGFRTLGKFRNIPLLSDHSALDGPLPPAERCQAHSVLSQAPTTIREGRWSTAFLNCLRRLSVRFLSSVEAVT